MEEKKKQSQEELQSGASNKKGLAKVLENIFRKYQAIGYMAAMIPPIIVYIICITLGLTPGYIFLTTAYENVAGQQFIIQALAMSFAFVMSYAAYALTLIFIVPFFNWIYPLKMKPFKGSWISLETLPWYYHNALTQLVRYTVLDFFQATPIITLFYKMMGMKIGKNCVINTTNISDPCLITLEDYVTIGGSATIFAHYAQAGFLVIAPTVIKRGATVGLKASIMGDVIIGEKVVVSPHEAVLPKSRLNAEDRKKAKKESSN
ncbi:acyltransferase [Halobacteriovorax sp. RT-2-1]|uniref:acyltransferase n=1 Tax=Halobacteriovorax sp. RT-2-1 TaxID=3391164 RepID=UPI00399AC986